MIDFERLPEKYEKGYPVKMGAYLGRIVGEYPDGNWVEVNGINYWNKPYVFFAEKGIMVVVGILHLQKLNEEELSELGRLEANRVSHGYPAWEEPKK